MRIYFKAIKRNRPRDTQVTNSKTSLYVTPNYDIEMGTYSK